MNLANLGLTAMNTAQHRLNTVGHNINNQDTEGYNRQLVRVSTSGATATGAGYVGRGVHAVTVQRAYDSFLQRQLVNAQTEGAALVSYGNEISQVNNLFADPSVGVSPALDKFFSAMHAVASAPADPAARQELLGRAGSLVGQINDANAFLEAQRGNINTQITTVVTQVNSYLERVADVNHQIMLAKAAASGHAPNDLLDQRDQLVSELSQLVGVNQIEHADGTVSLTVGNGQIALAGETVFPLHAIQSASDPTRTVVGYSNLNGTGAMTPVEMSESALRGGSLGGLIRYREEALDATQNNLGRLAAGLAVAFNELHSAGYTAAGVTGQDFFLLGVATAIRNQSNGTTGPSIQASVSDPNALTGHDYRITYVEDPAASPPVPPTYTVTRLSDNVQVFTGDQAALGAAEFDGLSIALNGAGAHTDGDSWLLQPTRHAADSIKVALTDPAQIAVADAAGGSANAVVGLQLAALKTGKVLNNGTMSVTEAFSQIVNKVGVLTQQNGTAAKAQASLIQQNYAAQQQVSGVNLNEELIMLDRYQDQFRAASRMIDTASALFDTILSLRN